MRPQRSFVARWTNALASVFWLLAGLGPSALSDDRTEYFHIAGSLSYDYGSPSGKRLQIPTLERLGVIETKATDVAVRRAAEVVAFGLRNEEKQRDSITQSIADAKAQAREMLASGRVGSGRHVEYYTDRDDFSGKLVTKSVEVDDGHWSESYCKSILEMPDSLTAEHLESRRRNAFLKSLSSAWDELLPSVPEKFAGPLSREPMVRIEYRGDGPGGQPLPTVRRPNLPFAPNTVDTFAGRHVATNVAKRDLNHVSFLVEMYHYSALSDSCARHVYFLPKWESGASVELSRAFVLDLKRGGRNYQVRSNAKTLEDRVVKELSGLAGVVRMRVTAWADEARQAPQMIGLPERTQVISEELVKQAEFVVKSPYAVTSGHRIPESRISKEINRQRKAAGNARGVEDRSGMSAEQMTQANLERLLKPVVELMPADSDLARQASRLLGNFKLEREKLMGRDDQNLLDACAEGHRYVQNS